MTRRLILLLVIFVSVAALVIAAIWTQVAPKYRAKAEVWVRAVIPYLVFQMEDNGIIPSYDSYVNTQVSIMRSLTVLQRVLDQKDVQKTQWYKSTKQPIKERLLGKPPVPPIERLRDTLVIRPRYGTEIMDVSLIDTNANDAKTIVNAVLNQYIKYANEVSSAAKDEIYRKITGEYQKLEKEIQGREQICAKLKKELGMGDPESLISILRVRLEDEKAKLKDLQAKIEVLQWEATQVNSVDSDNIPGASAPAPADTSIETTERQNNYFEDPEWRVLDRNVRTIQHRISMTELEPNHPDIIRETKEMKFAKELLQLRETQLDKQWQNQRYKTLEQDNTKSTSKMPIEITGSDGSGYKFEVGFGSVEHQLARAKQEEKLLLETIRRDEAEFENLFKNAQLLEKEEKSLAHKQELFQAVQRRLDEKNMERNVPGRIEVLMRAFAPSIPYKDRRFLYTAITLVLCGLGSAFSDWMLKRKETI
jgi:uncharacterized protein involved in exopolysaccharide biosynthesis